MHEAIRGTKYAYNKNKPLNISDLARLTIEQYVYISARRKTNINTQFEIALKETAIDCELNKYGNLLRFEEIIDPNLKIEGIPEEIEESKIFYCRPENKYYYYCTSPMSKLYNLTMNTTIDKRSVWPCLTCTVGSEIDITKNWLQHRIDKIICSDGELGVSIMVTENIKSFNGNPLINNMNFHELMKYAVNKGEDVKVWKYYEDRRIRNRMFDLVVNMYKLSEGADSRELYENFHDMVLSGSGTYPQITKKILMGNATRDITLEIGKIVKDKELIEMASKFTQRKTDRDDIQIAHLKKDLKKMFFKSDTEIEKMKEELINKYHENKIEVNIMSNAEIKRKHDECKTFERNKMPVVKKKK